MMGFRKYRTEVGAHAFIGSNSALVAPVKIGHGAYIGTGSVITQDVAPDALALDARTPNPKAWLGDRLSGKRTRNERGSFDA